MDTNYISVDCGVFNVLFSAGACNVGQRGRNSIVVFVPDFGYKQEEVGDVVACDPRD